MVWTHGFVLAPSRSEGFLATWGCSISPNPSGWQSILVLLKVVCLWFIRRPYWLGWIHVYILSFHLITSSDHCHSWRFTHLFLSQSRSLSQGGLYLVPLVFLYSWDIIIQYSYHIIIVNLRVWMCGAFSFLCGQAYLMVKGNKEHVIPNPSQWELKHYDA